MTANNKRVYVVGEKHVWVRMQNGTAKNIRFQVADVSKVVDLSATGASSGISSCTDIDDEWADSLPVVHGPENFPMATSSSSGCRSSVKRASSPGGPRRLAPRRSGEVPDVAFVRVLLCLLVMLLHVLAWGLVRILRVRWCSCLSTTSPPAVGPAGRKQRQNFGSRAQTCEASTRPSRSWRCRSSKQCERVS